jgi:hypothetical protein
LRHIELGDVDLAYVLIALETAYKSTVRNGTQPSLVGLETITQGGKPVTWPKPLLLLRDQARERWNDAHAALAV